LFWTKRLALLGISGFAAISPLRSSSATNVCAGLVSDTLAPVIGSTLVPSVNQFLDCKTNKELLIIKGTQSTKSLQVGEFSRKPAVAIWTPALLNKIVAGNKPSVSALDFLSALVRSAQDKVKNGTHTVEQIEAGWGEKVVSLWIIAKGWAMPSSKMGDAPDDDAVDDIFIAKMTRLSNSAGISPKRKHSDDKQSPKRKKVTLPTVPTPADPTDKQSTKRKKVTPPAVHTPADPNDEPPNKRPKKPKQTTDSPLPAESSDSDFTEPGPDDDDPDDESPESGDSPHDGEDDVSAKEPDSDTEDDSDSDDREHEKGSAEDDDPSDHDSSSSSSSSESSDSDKSTRHRRRRKRMMKKSTRSRTARSSMDRMLALAVDDIAFNTRSSAKREKKRSSLFSTWTDESIKLFKLLSARSWNERKLPRLNRFAKKLVADKKLTASTRLITKASRKWEGDILDSGLTSFLSGGFLAESIVDEPGGLSLFMCCPLKFKTGRTKESRAQHIQEVFGKGGLSAASLQEFSATKLFVPANESEAEAQLKVLIRFLDLLTGEASIASAGYRFGLKVLKDEGRKFHNALAQDGTFLIRYLYLLDCTFQQFCEKVLEYGTGSDPIGHAAKKGHLKRFQVHMIQSEMKSFLRIGAVPTLSLPGILRSSRREGLLDFDAAKPDKDPKFRPTDRDSWNNKRPGDDEPGWYITNDQPVQDWALPSGKAFKDFFGRNNPKNQKGFPKFKHHKDGKLKFLCLHYQVLGTCSRGGDCNMSHIRPSDLDAEKRNIIGKRFTEVYKS
jgi:hypothetical protein